MDSKTPDNPDIKHHQNPQPKGPLVPIIRISYILMRYQGWAQLT